MQGDRLLQLTTKMSSNFFRLTSNCFLVIALLVISGCLSACGGFIDESPAYGEVRTFHGFENDIGEPFGLAFDGTSLLLSDGESGRILRIRNNGETETLADGLGTPSHIAVDYDGSILVADSGSNTIERVTADGKVSIVAGVKNTPGYRDGDAASALFRAPIGIAVHDRKIYVADSYNDRIRVIENGRVSTLAGGPEGFADSKKGPEARFNTPCGIAVLPGGELLVADLLNRRIRLVKPDGATSTFAGNGRQMRSDGELLSASFLAPTDIGVSSTGEVFVADGDSVRVAGARFLPIVETISGLRRGFADGKAGTARFNRVSGLTFGQDGELYAADSGNGLVRVFSPDLGTEAGEEDFQKKREVIFEDGKAPARWPYKPAEKVREIAGTFGEVRGEMEDEDSNIYFHNGLDITGGYGEEAFFVIDEKVLDPEAATNVGTLRETLRMPRIAYIHVNLGRYTDGMTPNDGPFIVTGSVNEKNGATKVISVRIPRGTRFKAGDWLGTLNRMNHVHLVAGPEGREVNGLAVLGLPGISDSRPPVIESVEVTDSFGRPFETERGGDRIKIDGKIRIVVNAYDQMDGNAERRRLGVYKLGYAVTDEGISGADGSIRVQDLGKSTTLIFERLPEYWLADKIYAVGSRSGATGPTVFRYIVSNHLSAGRFREDFLDTSKLEPGKYNIHVFAEDFFGNRTFNVVRVKVERKPRSSDLSGK